MASLAAAIAFDRFSRVIERKFVEVSALPPLIRDYLALLGLFIALGVLVLDVLLEVKADSLLEDDV